jgi:hypothetical protein
LPRNTLAPWGALIYIKLLMDSGSVLQSTLPATPSEIGCGLSGLLRTLTELSARP